MDQNMITLATDMQFSKQRLEEIFAVPKTKQLYEQLIKQEKNEAQIKELIRRSENIFKREDVDGASEAIYIRLKVCILAASIESVVNGKPLNQAIQEELKTQLKEESAIKKVEANIDELERFCAMSGLLSGLIESMLS